jgi:uncharacterized membrane protein YsdA (DUF1294 family)
MSVLTICLYFLDKSRAAHRSLRLTEGLLHLCELLGGWPGAFLAQRFFRHKCRKRDFMLIYWTIVALHILFWAWYFGWIH